MSHPYNIQSLIPMPYPHQNICFYINNNPNLINSQNNFQSVMPNNMCAQTGYKALSQLQYLPIYAQQNYQNNTRQMTKDKIEQEGQQNSEYSIINQSQNYMFTTQKINIQPGVSFQSEKLQMNSGNSKPAQIQNLQNIDSEMKKFHSSNTVNYNNNHSCFTSESQIADITCQSPPSSQSIKTRKSQHELACASSKNFKQKETCSSFFSQKQEYNQEENEQTNTIQNSIQVNHNKYENLIANQQSRNLEKFKQKEATPIKNQNQCEHFNNKILNNQSIQENLPLVKSEFELPINLSSKLSVTQGQQQQQQQQQKPSQYSQSKNTQKKQKNQNKTEKNDKLNNNKQQNLVQDVTNDHLRKPLQQQDSENSQPCIFQSKLEDLEEFNSQRQSKNSLSVKSQQYRSQNKSQLKKHQTSNNSDVIQKTVKATSSSYKFDLISESKELTEIDFDQQQQYSSTQEPQIVKKYCKFSFIADSSQDNKKDMSSISKQSEIIIICSVKPKDKIKKSKQDYYNDSNYTKNLLKGFRRYMKRFSPDQLTFQQFQIYFSNNQLNNEFILRLFSDQLYSSYFNKFLSQPPHWWIQEAKIKDVEKQINFFNLCKQKKLNNIKTKRKSFERPQIQFE